MFSGTLFPFSRDYQPSLATLRLFVCCDWISYGLVSICGVSLIVYKIYGYTSSTVSLIMYLMTMTSFFWPRRIVLAIA